MTKSITWIALDTSKKKHVGAVLRPGSREPEDTVLANSPSAIRRWARKVVREASGPVRVCYEAGPCGFALQRDLQAAAPDLVVEVIAPALVPVRPGERVKTDRRDARKLVRLYRAGELTEVQAPSVMDEAVRDLTRARSDAREDLHRARQRLGKFLLRRGRIYAGLAWTHSHRQWLASQVWDLHADTLTYDDYRLAVAQLEARLQALQARIEAISREQPYAEPVAWLCCYRGIDTLTAMTLLTELHDLRRFERASSLMAYLGLVPSEHSSGERVRRGSITKAGNRHARRVLIQAAWNARLTPKVSKSVLKRRQNQPAWVIAHADRAMLRLHRRYWALVSGGKIPHKVVVAIARELVGFLWATVREGELRKSHEISQRVA